MKGHPHAQLAQQYWREAETDAEAWRNWQHRIVGDAQWLDCDSHPSWGMALEWRRKPRFILINGIEVPEPMREAPEVGAVYHIVSFSYKEGNVINEVWEDDDFSRYWLSLGLCHLTRESAEIHAQALLSFTKQ